MIARIFMHLTIASALCLAAASAQAADAKAGRVVTHEDVARWLDSWGTENELPPPKCG